ncbi:DUF2577 domain-containing protein [Agathobaculum sp. NTUH-O15-33]|uniref:DUF2577 domain-containing protein n=1 Tax=Agathobaculum sp. NTUH-O15-33 TaxID=3079302 RepID=UPI0029587213|nr:DUF2577 domain-containing protein [Agathobaculum sp. NTUH-O15-33]WNX84045.1 DUF2577 domain-containing protein [Agathobaculum sp. NTUH-O15-33]
MPDLFELIKTIAVSAVEARRPVEICFGTVQSTAPLTVRLSQKLVLEKEFFIVRQGVTTQSFKVGDKLILFRMQGGQQYLIYDKKGGL